MPLRLQQPRIPKAKPAGFFTASRRRRGDKFMERVIRQGYWADVHGPLHGEDEGAEGQPERCESTSDEEAIDGASKIEEDDQSDDGLFVRSSETNDLTRGYRASQGYKPRPGVYSVASSPSTMSMDNRESMASCEASMTQSRDMVSGERSDGPGKDKLSTPVDGSVRNNISCEDDGFVNPDGNGRVYGTAIAEKVGQRQMTVVSIGNKQESGIASMAVRVPNQTAGPGRSAEEQRRQLHETIENLPDEAVKMLAEFLEPKIPRPRKAISDIPTTNGNNRASLKRRVQTVEPTTIGVSKNQNLPATNRFRSLSPVVVVRTQKITRRSSQHVPVENRAGRKTAGMRGKI